MKLVGLPRAKAHLEITHAYRDDVISDAIEEASEIVLDYIKDRENKNEWTEETVPALIRAAVLLVLGSLWKNREGGGGEGDSIDAPNPLGIEVQRILHRYRDPALA